ncbi:MAG: penicillin-binding protein 1A [Rickettsiales bacterium]
MLQQILKKLGFWCSVFTGCIVLAGLFILPIFIYYSKDLPDYNQLQEYDPPTISRIYSSELDLMAELANERRIFRKIEEIPQVVIDAFLAAEDKNYYDHPGIDIFSIMRAAMQNVANIATDSNPVGGSTITQQVVKNFLLTNERSLSRKVKEAILAYRINKVYSKDRILELYLNQIYLGNSGYGVTSAALNYFNKDLDDVTLEEAALLAAMPKAPSQLDPTRHINKAKARRDWVIDRMLEENFIRPAQAKKAKETPIKLTNRFEKSILDNGYFTESVRLEMIDLYGETNAYTQGYHVYTNLNKDLQKYADDALRQGLIEYDRRHGFKGPIANVEFKNDEWKPVVKEFEADPAARSVGWITAIVLSSANDAIIGFKDGSKGKVPLSQLAWARKRVGKEGYVGKKIEAAQDAIKKGDVIYVSCGENKDDCSLQQIPEVNGAIVVMQPRTGKVLAMSGGFSFKESKYNRAIQAMRQPGSTFKPFVYLAALEKGYTSTSILKDEAISVPQGPGMPDWTPKNFEGKFMGEITLRTALEKSRNLATVYLITQIGINSVRDVATRMHVYNSPPKIYSMALGAYESTLMRMTSAFTSFASDGMEVYPKLIDKILDRKGRVIYTTDLTECQACVASEENVLKTNEVPKYRYPANYIIEPKINYQMVSILEGVVQRGTAQRAKSIGKTLAGKTGTTNDSNDSWFIGFSPDLVCGVYIGYDNPQSLGGKESGATVALPVFIKFMTQALKDMPDKQFDVPNGLEFVKVDVSTGKSPGVFSRTQSIVNEPIRSEDAASFRGIPNDPDETSDAADSAKPNPHVVLGDKASPDEEGLY